MNQTPNELGLGTARTCVCQNACASIHPRTCAPASTYSQFLMNSPMLERTEKVRFVCRRKVCDFCLLLQAQLCHHPVQA